MKIAVISDIHGNLEALKSVLDDIKKQGCEKIFCLGDLAMAGPQPQETIELFKDFVKKDYIELIQGNTDSYLGENSLEVCENIKKNNLIMGNACEQDLKDISPENLRFLKNLPEQKTIVVEGLKILLVHGSPRSNVENIFPGMEIGKVEEMLKNVDADIIFCGHTHQPCGYQTNTRQTVVNVGSVGRPLSEVPKACYVVLEIKNPAQKEFFVYHVNVNYDKEKAAEILKKRNFEGSEKLAAMILYASERYPL